MHEYTTELITNLLLPSFFDSDNAAKLKKKLNNRNSGRRYISSNDVHNSAPFPLNSIDIIDGNDYDGSEETVKRLKSTMGETEVQQLVLSELQLDKPVVRTLLDLLKSRCFNDENPWEGIYIEFCEGHLDKAVERILLEVDNVYKLEVACGMQQQRACIQSLGKGLRESQSLKELSLFMTLEEDDANQLIEGLSANRSVTRLRLTRSTLRPDCIGPMAAFLKSDAQLQVLSFDRCVFSDCDGLGRLLHSLVGHPTLKELYICGDLYEDSHQALSKLLTFNSLTKLCLQNRSAMTPSNSKLNTSHNGLRWITASLASNRTLKTLDLSQRGLDDLALLELLDAICADREGNFNHLEELRLHENHIGNEGVTQFASRMHDMSPKLKKIFLHRNRFDEIGADALLKGIQRSLGYIQELTIPSMGRSKAMTEYQRLISFETMLNSGGRQLLRCSDGKDKTKKLPSSLWPLILERSGTQLCPPYSELQMKSLDKWRAIQQADMIFYLVRGATGRAILGGSVAFTSHHQMQTKHKLSM